jgi:hypothetical protein
MNEENFRSECQSRMKVREGRERQVAPFYRLLSNIVTYLRVHDFDATSGSRKINIAASLHIASPHLE